MELFGAGMIMAKISFIANGKKVEFSARKGPRSNQWWRGQPRKKDGRFR
jgi:hypothetical protein